MPDLTITSAVPVAGSGLVYGDGIAGATFAPGLLAYRDATDGYKFKLAITSSQAAAEVEGLALHIAVAGQPLRILRAGEVTLGTTLAVGMVYCLSGSSTGLLCPVTDVDSGEYVTIVGVARTTAIMKLNIWNTRILSATNI